MPVWVVIVLVVIGGLFALKQAYVVSTGWLLPVTRGALFVSVVRYLFRAFPGIVSVRLYQQPVFFMMIQAS